MVSGGVVGWEKAEDVLCLSLYACPKMHYVMIMQGATHREARAVGGEPASSSSKRRKQQKGIESRESG